MSSSVTKIGIVGTGNMGRGIGIRFFLLGHPVFFGGRTPQDTPRNAAERATKVLGTGASPKYGSLDDAALFGDVIIWTTRELDPAKVLTGAGISALDGKIVLDVNNRDFADDVMGGPDGVGGKWFDKSLGEQLSANLPRSHIFKALNTIALETFDTSTQKLRDAEAQSFVAGSKSGQGKDVVLKLVASLGFQAVDIGDGPTAMRVAEAMADVYRYLIGHGAGLESNLGFRKLPRPDLEVVGPRVAGNYR